MCDIRLMSLKGFFHIVLNALYPKKCPLCDKFISGHSSTCDSCLRTVLFLEADAHFAHFKKLWFSKCRSRFAYDGPIRDAIHKFKYSERLDLVRFFSSELADEACNMGRFDLIVPVPLHRKRLAKRGFNQSAVLARNMAGQTGVPANLDSLKRARHIEPQVGMEREERIENVKGAFAVDPKTASNIAGRNILLVDDVLTTGATANECAKVLVRSGAREVSVLTIARTL